MRLPRTRSRYRPRPRPRHRCAVAALLLLPVAAACSATGGADPDQGAHAPADGAAVDDKGRAKPPVTDFNGDGYADLAVPAAGSDVGAAKGTGSVSVVYGGAEGVQLPRRKQVFSAASDDAVGRLLRTGTGAAATGFGSQSAAADLDGDGNTDLLLSLDGNGDTRSGPKTVVLWGSRVGLGSPILLPPVAPRPGDFDGDGHIDLLAHGHDGREGMFVLRGPFRRDGKPAGSTEVRGGDWGDATGPGAVTVGDLNGDRYDDVVTAQGFEEERYKDYFFKGGPDGLSAKVADLDAYNALGAVGDFDCDGVGDLAVQESGKAADAEETGPPRIQVLRGSTSAAPSGARTLDVPGAAGVTGEDTDVALAAADVDDDGCADLAVGVPGAAGGGAVTLLKGGAQGLSGAGARTFTQNSPGVPGNAEAGDLFGGAVRFADFDKDGHQDLAVGAPGEDGAEPDSGAVWILDGTARGPEARPDGLSFGPEALLAPVKGAGAARNPGTGFGAAFR